MVCVDLTDLDIIPVPLTLPASGNVHEIVLYYFTGRELIGRIERITNSAGKASRMRLIHRKLKECTKGEPFQIVLAAERIVEAIRVAKIGENIKLKIKYNGFSFDVTKWTNIKRTTELYYESLKT